MDPVVFPMMNFFRVKFALLGLAGYALLLSGCGPSQPAYFRLNLVAMRGAIDNPDQRQQVANIMTALFGTPDKPVVLKELKDAGIDEKLVRFASGPVGTDQYGFTRGLFREHCAHCHGVTGDGNGPTAIFLNPYPRDYRPGLFKFKATVRNNKPRTEDLEHILEEGIPGTAMPSFKLLAPLERRALVDYVKYLSIRGETELHLINMVKTDLGEKDAVPTSHDVLIDSLVKPIADTWTAPEVLPVAEKPKLDHEESVKLGRDLFYGKGNKVECMKCHGYLALGDGGQKIYDDWTKKEITPEDEAAELALGALPRRIIIPRNLRQGVYRGGRRPIDIYRRVMAGINGTPMPEAPKTLSTDEAWHLVDYVLSLPYEAFSEHPQPKQMGHVVTPN
jgi:mono/diheme cytochrome c family protein